MIVQGSVLGVIEPRYVRTPFTQNLPTEECRELPGLPMRSLGASDTGIQLQIDCASLVGKRVQVRALKACGSARFLDGLQGTVIATHAIALNWVIVLLDPNARTSHLQWSIPLDRLVVCEEGEPLLPSAID